MFRDSLHKKRKIIHKNDNTNINITVVSDMNLSQKINDNNVNKSINTISDIRSIATFENISNDIIQPIESQDSLSISLKSIMNWFGNINNLPDFSLLPNHNEELLTGEIFFLHGFPEEVCIYTYPDICTIFRVFICIFYLVLFSYTF